MGFKKLLLPVLGVVFSLVASAQTATITGTVTDAKTNETLIGATIYLDGTSQGTITDFDGNYRLDNVQPGTYTLRCSFISYAPKSVEQLVLTAGQELTQDFALGESTVEIEDVKVVAKANRESETMLLMDQKEAAVMKESIGAQQLSAQGVSDAASAATKITGVSKQEGAKTLNIRGLGDRYNSTTLNGLPLPSNNAETKNIDLGLFASDVIGSIGVEKVATSPLYGDFAGANVDIVSKKFTGDAFLELGIKSGLNTSVLDADQFYLQDGPGYLGFDNFQQTPSLDTYGFETSWNPVEKTALPNLGFSLSGGKSFELYNSKLNAFFTASFDNDYSYSDLMQRRINGSDDIRKNLQGEQFEYATQTTAMLNLNWERKKSDFYFNTMMLNSSNQELKNLRGYIKDLAEDSALIQRSEFERTTILVNQLLGKHELNEQWSMNWGISFNHVKNLIPDRRHLSLNGLEDGRAYFTDDNESDNFRYFHEFTENEYALNLSTVYRFGEGLGKADHRGTLTLGYSGKYKERNFEATQFNHDIYRNRNIFNPPPGGYLVYVDVMDVDAFLNDANLQRADGYGFYLKTFFGNSIRPSTYDGKQFIHAGFADLNYQLSPRLQAVLGLRLEQVNQTVDFVTALDTKGGSGEFDDLQILPSLSMRYTLNDKSNLRFATSKTYVLPQFTEMALFLFEGITETTVGNPYLYPSKVYNGDLKWEFFPRSGELLSVTAFGKYISDPMNRVVMASASNDFTYANTGDWAYLYGAEFELKKDLWSTTTGNGYRKLFATANLTLMETKQDLNGEKVREETKDANGNSLINTNFNTDEDVLQGAAPLLANASLGYKVSWAEGAKSISSSLVYGYVSDRLYLIGFSSFGNQVDKEVHTLDYVLKSSFNKLGISLSAKNILNSDIDRVQENASGDHLIRSYKQGVKLSIGVSYQF